MTDPATPPPPLSAQLVINPSVVRTLAINVSLALSIVVTTLATLAGFVSNRDLAGWIVWVKSEDFVSFLGAIGLLATLGAYVWRSLTRKWREVYLARHVKDEVAVVKTPSPPPSVESITPPGALIVLLLIGTLLAGCATLPTATSDRGAAIREVAHTAALVADARGEAPPATLTRTTIDEKAIHAAFVTFGRALDLIDALRDSGVIKPGSPAAIATRNAIRASQSALNAASAAQRAGSATSYTAALSNAEAALANLAAALKL